MKVQAAASTAVAIVAAIVAAVAYASGQPPVAVADSATVVRGGTVSVLSNGQTSVLANDTDPEHDPLTAQLTHRPTRGTLVFHPDGTFVYTHRGNGNASDEFRYRASDGTLRSPEARVTIAVTNAPPAAPRITGQRALTTKEDVPIQITLQDLTVEDADSVYPANFSLILRDGANYSLQGSTVVPDPDFNGVLTVPTRVNDGQSGSNEFPLVITVQSTNDAPVVKHAVPAQLATEGEAFALDLTPFFGDVDVGDSLVFSASGLPPSGSLTLTALGALGGTPVATDAQAPLYHVTVTARDRAGASVSTQFALTVRPRRSDLALRITATPDPATVSDSLLWSLEAANTSSSASGGATLTADWRSGTTTLTLSAPTGCTIAENGTERPTLACGVPALAAGAVASFQVQSQQSVPGDVAVRAHLDLADANPLNNDAFKSLNVAGSFAHSSAQRLAGSGVDLAVGDLDSDNRNDLVAVGDRTRVYFRSGPRTFEQTPVSPPGDSAGDFVVLVDWNGDTHLDIAVLRRDGEAGHVFMGDGQRGLAAGVSLPAIAARGVATIDANLDGDNELVVTGPAGTMLLAPGANLKLLDSRPGLGLAVADFDGDGRMDIAVALGGGGIAVLESNGDGSFATTSQTGFGSIAAIAASDLSGDGAPDLLLAIDAVTPDTPQNLVLRNERDGTFAPLLQFGATTTTQFLTADVNADGLKDLIAINTTGVHEVYLAQSDAGLALQSEFVFDPGTVTARLADIDGDGAPDLLLAGATATTVDVLRNDGRGRFGLGDVTPPVIKLVGDASVTIKATSTYVDAGAIAIDDVSGDLTGSIVVKSSVDTTVIGTYTVTYDVTDKAGNAAATVSRSVTVDAAGEGGGGGYVDPRALVVLAALLLLRVAQARGGSRFRDAPRRTQKKIR